MVALAAIMRRYLVGAVIHHRQQEWPRPIRREQRDLQRYRLRAVSWKARMLSWRGAFGRARASAAVTVGRGGVNHTEHE